MEDAAPSFFDFSKPEEILIKKEYKLIKKKEIYKLLVYIDKFFIYFKITENNHLSYFYYQNKYNYDKIIEILELDNTIFINLEIIFDLIENALINNDVKIKFDNNNNINLKIKLIKDNQKNKYILILNKLKLNINVKFSLIINELNNIKKENND